MIFAGNPEPLDLPHWGDQVPGVVTFALPASSGRAFAVSRGEVFGHLLFKSLS